MQNHIATLGWENLHHLPVLISQQVTFICFWLCLNSFRSNAEVKQAVKRFFRMQCPEFSWRVFEAYQVYFHRLYVNFSNCSTICGGLFWPRIKLFWIPLFGFNHFESPKTQQLVSEVGFEPTPTFVDQKGEVLATCSPVTCVCKSSSLLLSNSPQQLTPDLLENVELSPEQKSSAERLFQEFEDVFSRNSSDIGHTTVTQHRIDTADHPPIKQHPRRLPFAKQEEVGTLLREMQENDIIEPSSSPWASQSSWFVRKMAPQDFAWTIENLTTSPRRTATLFQG
ncbi:retroviral aspartyl protease family protein [Trichonephila clavipes]|nr:retroviral aspartyl protease family protein [Trichonephila clavipes]